MLENFIIGFGYSPFQQKLRKIHFKYVIKLQHMCLEIGATNENHATTD